MIKPDVTAGGEVDKNTITVLTFLEKWKLPFNLALWSLLTIYMLVLFILLLGCGWLALILTVTVAGYWFYLIFVTRLTFLDYLVSPVMILLQVIDPVKVSKLFRSLFWFFWLGLIPISLGLTSASLQESLHSPRVWFLAGAELFYFFLLLIPQLYHSRVLSKPVYSALMADWLEKRFDAIPSHLAKLAAQGYNLGVAVAKGEPMRVFEEDVTPADTVLRRYYANVLVPYLPAHAFVFGLIAYLVTQRVSFATTGFPIGDFTVQLFLVIASIIIPFIAFIDFPFWLGQRDWKIEILGQLRKKLRQIKGKIEKSSEGDKETRDQFEYALKMHKFYQEGIDKVTKIPMHPYDFQVSLWVFVWGLISSSISQFVMSWLPPK